MTEPDTYFVAKMQGIGNKILVLDLRDGSPLPTPEQARAIHNAPHLDYDQLMIITPPRTSDTLAFVQIYNNDGSFAEACGNGMRCVADRLARETGRATFVLETVRGLMTCERLGENYYRIDMGSPRFHWQEIPCAWEVDTRAVTLTGFERLGPASLVNMGNPHAVFFVEDLTACDIAKEGTALERHALFPHRANISFAQRLGLDHIQLQVWERGAGATRACGSGACATLVALVRRWGGQREAKISQPGGDLFISWPESQGGVFMSGAVDFERNIAIPPSIMAKV